VEHGASRSGFASVRRPLWLFLSVSLTAVACGAGGAADGSTVTADPSDETRTPEAIEVALSLHVVVDADSDAPAEGDADAEGDDQGEVSPLSSNRTEDGLRRILERVGTIWRGTGVTFAPVEVDTVEVPSSILTDLAAGDPQSFLAGVGRQFEVPAPGTIDGFYVADLFGVNGFAPPGTQAFFVADQPTVHDERVSSHEIGHVFGLEHTLDDAGRLLFPGSNGMSLTETEIVIARDTARELADAAR
jgi:hypothetical protein